VDAANTDIRYNFPLGGRRVALVAGFSSTKGGLVAWAVNPVTRLLEDVTAPGAKLSSGGGTLYYSNRSRKYYWFSNNKCTLTQHELFDNGRGQVDARLVRTFAYGSGESEGAVADDILGFVYVSEETAGIWKIPAEPTAKNEKTLVDQPVERGGRLHPDIEGLTIYYKPDGTGYLIASSQGNHSYIVYTREGSNRHLGAFTIGDGVVDGTTSTDGIDVTNLPLGPAFPHGLFVAQDGFNVQDGVRVNQNFKYVPFERIATALGLTMDASWDPRQVGR
jgi:3-phytase